MNGIEVLSKEISDILARPDASWNPMTIPRIRKALSEAHETIKALKEILDEQEDDVRFIRGIRKDAKMDRNIELIVLHKKGASQSSLAKKYGLTRQRVHSIIRKAERNSENHNGRSA